MKNYILGFCWVFCFCFSSANSKGDFNNLRLTSAHCTLAMYPLFCSSIQLASNSLGPIRKLRSTILSSSLTSVAVSPSLQCAWTMVRTRRNILAADKAKNFGHYDEPPHSFSYTRAHLAVSSPGIVCTSSRIISPHSWLLIHSITLSASHERLVVWPSIE